MNISIRDGSQPTLADIAEQAGVSLASVSRVLNDGPVSESMRRRVVEAMQVLGYDHVGARPAVRKSQGTIAVVIADLLNPYFAEMLRGAEDEAETNDWAITLLTTGEEQEREARALERLSRIAVDGVIISGSRLPAQNLIELQEKLAVPIVVLNRHIKHPEIACILVDLERTTYRATRHLLDLGHARIAYLAGPGAFETSQLRRSGIERALLGAGVTLRPEWCPTSFPNVEGGFQAMSALLSEPDADRPTAVITYNDMMALGALNAIRNSGLRVPDDISLVSFDDIVMAAHASPPLTTISQPKYRMGKLAVRILRQRVLKSPGPAEGFVLMESPLIVRQSTGPVHS